MKIWLATVLACFLRLFVLVFYAPFRGRDYRLACGLGEDKAWNAILAGNPNEYISSRAYRCSWPVAEPFINWLFGDPMHCRKSFEDERFRANAPREYRTDFEEVCGRG